MRKVKTELHLHLSIPAWVVLTLALALFTLIGVCVPRVLASDELHPVSWEALAYSIPGEYWGTKRIMSYHQYEAPGDTAYWQTYLKEVVEPLYQKYRGDTALLSAAVLLDAHDRSTPLALGRIRGHVSGPLSAHIWWNFVAVKHNGTVEWYVLSAAQPPMRVWINGEEVTWPYGVFRKPSNWKAVQGVSLEL